MSAFGGRDEQRARVLARHRVSRETIGRLDAYEALLLTWQRRTNLVAPSTLPDLWERHIGEGLLLAALIPEGTRQVADLGSGGGLPGLIVAVLLKERGAGTVDLVESNGKKAAFLRQAIRALDLPADVHAERIERVPDVVARADVVTARALAPLRTLLEWVAPHLKPGARCLFPKGREHEAEIAAATQHFRFDMVKHPSTGEPESVVLELRSLEALTLRNRAAEPDVRPG